MGNNNSVENYNVYDIIECHKLECTNKNIILCKGDKIIIFNKFKSKTYCPVLYIKNNQIYNQNILTKSLPKTKDLIESGLDLTEFVTKQPITFNLHNNRYTFSKTGKYSIIRGDIIYIIDLKYKFTDGKLDYWLQCKVDDEYMDINFTNLFYNGFKYNELYLDKIC